MELQDRVTVVLTKHGANVLNNQNNNNELFRYLLCGTQVDR